jgi:hypothetical protein
MILLQIRHSLKHGIIFARQEDEFDKTAFLRPRSDAEPLQLRAGRATAAFIGDYYTSVTRRESHGENALEYLDARTRWQAFDRYTSSAKEIYEANGKLEIQLIRSVARVTIIHHGSVIP